MTTEQTVPEELQHVITELAKNWFVSDCVEKSAITPIYIESDCLDYWVMEVTLNDYSFKLPWHKEITLKVVSEHYGFTFRLCCYSVLESFKKGVETGKKQQRESVINALKKLIDSA